MFKLITLLFILFLFISCSEENSKNNIEVCKEHPCKGDIRYLNCPNKKPLNSHWKDINKDGKIKQYFNGNKYEPDIYECFWECDDNYELIGNECLVKCNEGYEYFNGECILKCDEGYEYTNGECKPIEIENDRDNDGINDEEDNCPNIYNPLQEDTDGDEKGDKCEIQDGSPTNPFIITPMDTYHDSKNTENSPYSFIDVYPPNTLNESGPEYYYIFKLKGTTKVKAYIDFPEPENTDIDLHLLKTLNPLNLITRGHYRIEATLNEGVYYIVMDTYFENEEAKVGNYNLTVEFTPDYAGTIDDPIELGTLDLPFSYHDLRNTKNAESSFFDTYPPNELNEGGHEYIYHFRVNEEVRFTASIENPEPENTDIDLHLISSLDRSDNGFLIDRGNYSVYSRLEAGDYYLVLDSYVNNEGIAMEGQYNLTIMVNQVGENNDNLHFNYYILEAVDYLYANYGLLGYASANLTHDIQYGDDDINSSGHYGIINRSGGARTMCVSAQMEVILTAMQIYADDTGDYSVYEYLPVSSWKTINEYNIKGHIWVDHNYSSGTADALKNFGMGEVVPFEQLKPGSFINLNRTNGTGHATTFLAFLDENGNEYSEYPSGVEIIGFKYFSAQGKYEVGKGGFDYRWAIFSNYSTPSFCAYKKCDLNVIDSDNQAYLNTGMMFMPQHFDRSAEYYPGSKKSHNKKKIKITEDFYPVSPSTWNGLTSYETDKR